MTASKEPSGQGRVVAEPRETVGHLSVTRDSCSPLSTHSKHSSTLPVASPQTPDSAKSQTIGRAWRPKVWPIFAPPVFSGYHEHSELFQSARRSRTRARYVITPFARSLS